MKLKAMVLAAAILCAGGNLYAANGDLVVKGNLDARAGITVGTGITYPDGSVQTTAKKLIWDELVTAATSSLSSPTLNGQADGEYLLEVVVQNGVTSQPSINLFYNGDTTPANYSIERVQVGAGAGAPATSTSGGSAQLACSLSASAVGTGWLQISARISIVPSPTVGMYRVRTSVTFIRNDLTSGTGWQWYEVNVADLTGLTFATSTGANGIGANSRFRLWRLL